MLIPRAVILLPVECVGSLQRLRPFNPIENRCWFLEIVFDPLVPFLGSVLPNLVINVLDIFGRTVELLFRFALKLPL